MQLSLCVFKASLLLQPKIDASGVKMNLSAGGSDRGVAPLVRVNPDYPRRALERGVDALANTVKVTLGPKGRYVVLDKKYGAPTITNDGVTVAKEVELTDPYENLGAQLAKEVATKTNDVAGDGTTTAPVVAQALVHEGLRAVPSPAPGRGFFSSRGLLEAMLSV